MSDYPRNWLCKVNIYRGPDELYLTRYVIFRCRWFSLYIHQFHMSDYPVPHDHPWWWCSIPLTKGYLENFADNTTVNRKPLHPVIRDPHSFHWVQLKPGTESKVWTFFATGPRVRDWGFLTPTGWVHHEKYNESLG